MNLSPEIRRELCDLLGSLRDGQIDDPGLARLDHLVTHNTAARRLYLDYVDICVALHWSHEKDSEPDIHPSSFIPHISPIPSIVVDPSPTIHSSAGNYIFSHVAAAVILGIGLLIGLAWRISLPVEGNSHRQSPNIAPNHRRQESPPTVARITALADCKWTKQGPGVRDPGSGISNRQILKSSNPQIPICLGDHFILSAGLMQITYDTGTKVLLQGPCTYEIESDRSGYLAVGKLTAKVEKGSGARGPGSGNANHSPLSPLPSPLFAVRTPTALVTDLGTEFGVEVEESGATRSHVFQGSVELRVSNSRRSTTSGKSVKILHAGQSAHVKRTRNNKVAITRELGQPNRFVRRITKSSSQTPGPKSLPPDAYAQYVLSLGPAAYYRMERPKSAKDRLKVFDSAPDGCHGVFHSRDKSVSPYAPGLFGDAMVFRGDSLGDFVGVPSIVSIKDNRLTVAAWVMIAEAQPDPLSVFTLWGQPANQAVNAGVFHFVGTASPEKPHCWRHLAYVIHDEAGETTAHIYHNGIESKSKHLGYVWPKLFDVNWGIGGIHHRLASHKTVTAPYWQGRIDEVAIFNKTLSPETIERLYLGGADAAKRERTMNHPWKRGPSRKPSG